MMKTPNHLFLGEPTWETLASGRVRCVETGHEMAVEVQATYSQTKKCRTALFDAALKKRAAPLNFFQQSPDNKDKIVCKLTGVVLNKKEDAVWKHMMGKKFEAKLAEREAEKETARGDVEMAEKSDEEQLKKKTSSKKKEKILDDAAMMGNDLIERQSSKKREKKKGSKSGKCRNGEEVELGSKSLHDEEDEDDGEAGSSGSSDFWVPPPGDRWDFDNGNEDRWSQPGDPEGVDKTDEREPDNDIEMADGPHEDGMENFSSGDDTKIRTKRIASGLSKQTKRRKAKRSKTGEINRRN